MNNYNFYRFRNKTCIYSDKDLGFEDLETVNANDLQEVQDKSYSNDLIKLDSGEGMDQFVPEGILRGNKNNNDRCWF